MWLGATSGVSKCSLRGKEINTKLEISKTLNSNTLIYQLMKSILSCQCVGRVQSKEQVQTHSKKLPSSHFPQFHSAIIQEPDGFLQITESKGIQNGNKMA